MRESIDLPVVVLLTTTARTTSATTAAAAAVAAAVVAVFSFFTGLLLGVVSALGQLGSEFFFALLLLFNGKSGTTKDVFLGLVGTAGGV